MAYSTATRSVLPVLDAPSPWVAQFLCSADPSTRGSLFMSCRQLRDMMLNTSSKVRLQADPTSPSTIFPSLQRLTGCKDGAEVELILKVPSSNSDNMAPHVALWLANTCAYGSLTPSLPLHRITTVELEGVVTEDLVPPSLHMACPNIRHIKHTRYRPWLKHPSAIMGQLPIPCPQIKKLSLDSEVPPSDDVHMTVGRSMFFLQLQALPNLQDIYLYTDQSPNDAHQRVFDLWDFGVQHVLQRLKALEVHDVEGGVLECLYERPWPELESLHILFSYPTSQDLAVFSTYMPKLATISLPYVPDEWQFACTSDALSVALPTLQHLTVYAIGIEDLVTLPLRGLKSFEFHMLNVDGWNISHVPAAIANLTSCPHVGAHEQCLVVELDRQFPLEPTFNHILPLLKQLSYQELLIPAVLLLEDGSAALFTQLPQLKTLAVSYFPMKRDERRLLPRVTALCVQARWPATLKMGGYWTRLWGRGWQQQLREAMRAAGHQHITLEQGTCL